MCIRDSLRGKQFAPGGSEDSSQFDAAVERWKQLTTDEGATYDRVDIFNAADIAPQVTWGTNPGQVTAVDSAVPSPDDFEDATERKSCELALEYMDLKAGTPITDVAIDRVFIGSCTNSRIEDLRAAASIVKNKKVSDNVSAMVVPGSGAVSYTHLTLPTKA